MNETQQRAAVVAEARSWLRTPYVSHAKLKGIGADCGTFLAAVYANAGIFLAKDLPDLPPQWFMHGDREWYLEYLAQYAVEYGIPLSWPPPSPQPGDIICAKHGRAFSHGAIVTVWPHVHALLSAMRDGKQCSL